jgi:hypothetical protein
MTREFDEAFHVCLELIREGRETLESVVARYPEYAEELQAQLEAVTWLFAHKAALEPRPEFVAASRRRLVARIKEGSRPAPLTWKDRLRQAFDIQRVAPVAFVAVLMIFLFIGGTVVTVARNSLPGDPLYSVKRNLEQIALATSLDKSRDAKLRLQFVEARLTEIKELIEKGRSEKLAETVVSTQVEIDRTVELIEEIAATNPVLAEKLADEFATLLIEQYSIFLALSREDLLSDIVFFNTAQAIAELTREVRNELSVFEAVPPTPTAPLFPTATPTKTLPPPPTSAPTQQPFTSTPTQKPPTSTPTPIPPTKTPTPIPPTKTPTPTNTPNPTDTPTPTPTDTPTETPTETPTDTPTATPTETPTDTPTPTPTDTLTPVATETSGVNETVTVTPTPASGGSPTENPEETQDPPPSP